MERNQVKLLSSLAKQLKKETKEKNAVAVTLQSAKILTKAGNFTGTYGSLKKISSTKKQMYSSRPNLYIGFHGCEKTVCEQLVLDPHNVKKSQEAFDWLGHGFYVWENNFERALNWAEDKKKRGQIKDPAVIGVVYQLNYSLDFTDSEFTSILAQYFELMKSDLQIVGQPLPENKDLPKDQYHDKIIRELDCAVIEYLHQKISEQIQSDKAKKGFSEFRHFDTVRGVFTEGGPAFDGAGVQLKNHIQICIRNLNCIKGFFIPRKEIKFP